MVWGRGNSLAWQAAVATAEAAEMAPWIVTPLSWDLQQSACNPVAGQIDVVACLWCDCRDLCAWLA